MEAAERGLRGGAGSSADSLPEEEEDEEEDEEDEEGPRSGRSSRTSSLVSGLLTELYSAAEAGSARAGVLRELQRQRRPSQGGYLRLKGTGQPGQPSPRGSCQQGTALRCQEPLWYRPGLPV